MSQKLSAQPLAFLLRRLGTLSHTCNIDKLNTRICGFLGLEYLRQWLQTSIRYLHNGMICLHRTGSIAANGRSCLSERIKQCGLAALWQTNNTDSESHLYII